MAKESKDNKEAKAAKETKSKQDAKAKPKTEAAKQTSSSSPKQKQIKSSKPEKTTKSKPQPKPKAKVKAKAKQKPKSKPVAKGKAKATSKAKSKKGTKDKDAEAADDEVEIVDEELEEEELEEEEEEYYVKQKPELTAEMKNKLRKRTESKKHKPKFKRQEWFRYKKLDDSWRKPRGLHSKMRTNRKYRINRVRVGYKTTEDVRGLHSSGFKEKLVYNKSDLDGLDPKLEAARIGHSVGTRKRIEIEEHADELGIRVLNRG
jgi:large subunit ribosomal protein L32e